MSNLEELIERLCPDGVEYKEIGEIYTRLRGTPITAGKMKEIQNDNGDIKVFAGGKTIINAFEQDIPRANITRVPSVLVQSRGVIDFVFYDKPFTFKNEMWAYTADTVTEVKFLYYVLKNNVQHFKEAASGMGSLPQISLKVTENFKLPVPPLEVQREIVRILDNFTFLTTELAAELAARQKQYEYYRDLLLTFKSNESTILNERTNELELSGAIRWMKLGDIADIGTGNGNTNEGLDTGKYPFFVRSQDIKYKNEYDFDETAIITSGDGVGVGKIFHFVSGKYALHQRAYRVHIISDNVLPKYFFYYFKNSFLTYISKASFHSSVTSIRRPMMINFPVPVPPLEVQQRIVGILDRFDVLCNDISSGLPAEIEARQKQYEYYRDKLLTFKELKKEA